MYAVISDRNNQVKVRVGDEVLFDLMQVEPGSPVTFDQVLLVGDEGEIKVGKPLVEGASVTGEVLADEKGKKLVIFRFKRRKNVRRKSGHRQRYTRIRITAINR